MFGRRSAVLVLIGVGVATAVHGSMAAGKAVGTSVYAGYDAGLGEIRTSMLDPEQFRQVYGPDWVILAGPPSEKAVGQFHVDATALRRRQLSAHVPDARGRFLRMANHDACGPHSETRPSRPDQLQSCTENGFDPDNGAVGQRQESRVGYHQHDNRASKLDGIMSGGRAKAWLWGQVDFEGVEVTHERGSHEPTTGPYTKPGGRGEPTDLHPPHYDTRPSALIVNFYMRTGCETAPDRDTCEGPMQ